MSKYQLYIVTEASSSTEKTTILKLKKIKSAESEIWYSFPEELQTLGTHKNLLELPAVKNAVHSIKSRGQYRSVNVIFSSDLEKLYMDDAGNFTFNNFLLPETTAQQCETTTQSSSGTGLSELASCLKVLVERKEEPLTKIANQFLIEKFSTRNKNVQAWVIAFEREAARFSLSGTRLIEVFRSCLDQSLNDWFSNAQKKLGIEADWDNWKENLISTFSDDSYTPIRYAYGYRHMTGSFIDFVLKKERLLLDLDHDIPDKLRLNLIVLGLPIKIQNELERSSMNSLEDLISKVKKYDYEVQRKTSQMDSAENKATPNSRATEMSGKSQKATSKERKHPCSICEQNNRGTRYHQEKNCWFKDTNKVKAVNNLEIETELNSKLADQKN